MMMDEQEILTQLRQGSTDVLSDVYKKYRSEFINWSFTKYAVEREEAKDIYQNSIIIFYENILQKKLTSLNSSIKTYIFGIGKNKIREHLRNKGKTFTGIDTIKDDLIYEEPSQNTGNEEQYKLFKQCLDEMGDPCKSLLVSFYFKNFTMKELAHIFNYKNEATAKNSKYKCLQRLKTCYFSKADS